MSEEFPIEAPTVPVILQETDGLAHVGFRTKAGKVYIMDSCGDQLRYFPRDIRDAPEIQNWHGHCAEAMIHV